MRLRSCLLRRCLLGPLLLLLTPGSLVCQTEPPAINSSKEADFPADIPRLSGASISTFSVTGPTASAFFVTSETPTAVTRIYQEFATRDGWTMVPIPGPPLEKESVFIARKGKRTLRVDAVPDADNGETEVFLLVVVEPPPPPPRPVRKVQP